MGKIRAARMRKIRNIVLACLVGYLLIPGIFVVRYVLAQQGLTELKGKVSAMKVQFGHVDRTLTEAKVLDAAINFDKYPIEIMSQAIRPLYEPGSEVRITSLEVNRQVHDSDGEEKSDIAIKGETSSPNGTAATRYGIKVKNNLKNYKWESPKVDAPKDGKVAFQINGTLAKPDDDATAQR
jgi:hypothetical protein